MAGVIANVLPSYGHDRLAQIGLRVHGIGGSSVDSLQPSSKSGSSCSSRVSPNS